MAKKILIADDEKDMLKVITTQLVKEGYEVIAARDGREALQLARDQKPDLVLLDYSMPGLKGDEVCEEIKSDPELKHIPVIFSTASPGFFGHQVMETTKADDYLIKPFRSADLVATVKRYLS